MVKVFITDVDGVLTDGKLYISQYGEMKTISYQDLDALNDIRAEGIKIAVVTGEENNFTAYINEKIKPDLFYSNCKKKDVAILDIARKTEVDCDNICYIGDGKYDIPAIRKAGLSMCPSDAIPQVKEVSDVILNSKGGSGCIAEAYTYLKDKGYLDEGDIVMKRLKEHGEILDCIINDESFISQLYRISDAIVKCYTNNGKVLLCGNGGSAADAQHLAAELVSRFYRERRAYSAEALNTNTSIITAIGNDYDYTRIFSRGVEAQGKQGDILIGISTSGKSQNIIEALKMAKKLKMETILFTGHINEDSEILDYTDYLLSIPSKDTPRIQEMHILSGHIMCEIVENIMSERGI